VQVWLCRPGVLPVHPSSASTSRLPLSMRCPDALLKALVSRIPARPLICTPATLARRRRLPVCGDAPPGGVDQLPGSPGRCARHDGG
jgi:hypothetical protein